MPEKGYAPSVIQPAQPRGGAVQPVQRLSGSAVAVPGRSSVTGVVQIRGFSGAREEEEQAQQDLRKVNKYSETMQNLETLPLVGDAAVIGRMARQRIHSSFAIKQADAIQQNQMQLQDQLLEGLRESRDKGDDETSKRYLKLLKESVGYENDILNIVDYEIAAAPSSTQVIGAAASMALWSVGGYKSPAKFSNPATSFRLGKNMNPVKSAQTAYQILKNPATSAAQKMGAFALRYGGVGIKSGTRMSLFTGTTQMKIEDASVEDILKAGERGFKTGFVIGPAITATLDTAGGLFQHYGPTLLAKKDALMMKMERVAAGKEQAKIGSEFNQKFALVGEKVDPTFKEKAAKAVLGVDRFFGTAKAKLVDRYDPLAKMEDRIRRIKDAPLSEKEKIYRDVRMLDATTEFKAGIRINNLEAKLKNYTPEQHKVAKKYLETLDFIDRAQRGQAVPGGKTLLQLKKELASISATANGYGPDFMKGVGEIRTTFNNYTQHEIWQHYKAGLISKTEAKRILDAHPNYIPHDVMNTGMERYTNAHSTSLSVSKSGMQKAVGSIKDINDPYAAAVKRTIVLEKLREKNILMNNIMKAQTQHDVMPGAKKIAEGAKPGEGFIAVNFFEDGKKQTWQVPNLIGDAIKNLDSAPTSNFWRIATTPQRIMKLGATQLNPGFMLRNKARDLQTAAMSNEGFITSAQKKYGFDPKLAREYSAKEVNEIYKRGGFGSTIMDEAMDRSMTAALKKGNMQTLGSSAFKASEIPKTVRRMNLAVEQSTRKSVLARALASGLSHKDATFVSRNATIDYAKMGSWMRIPNQVIPFLNARMQGMINIPTAAMANPEAFGQIITNTSIMPTMLLYQHNRRFESYKYLNQEMKNSNWIIMTGEIPAINPYTGDSVLVPQFMRIRRGEAQSVFSAPLSHYLEKQDGIDNRSVSEMFADMFGSLTPVDFGSYSRQQNLWSTMASSVGPAGSIPYGAATGEHAYFGSKIVPSGAEDAHREARYGTRTPELLKDIPKEFYRSGFGEMTNLSPAMLDYFISVFGGMPQDIMKAADMAYGVIRGKETQSVTGTGFETLSELPVIGGFFGQSLSNTTEAERKEVDAVRRDVATESVELRNQADDIVRSLRTAKTPEQKRNIINTLGDELTEELAEAIIRRGQAVGTVNGLRPTDPAKVRALVIKNTIEEMQSRNASDEELVEFFQELEQKRILNDSVAREIVSLNQ